MNVRALLFTYFTLLLLSIGVFFVAGQFPGKEYGVASPGFFPQLLAVLLFTLSLYAIIDLWRKRKRDEYEKLKVPKEVLAAMGITLVYIQAMHLIGYFPSTFIYIFVVMVLVRGTPLRIGYVLLHSLILTGLSFVLFKVILNAYLPKGIWFE